MVGMATAGLAVNMANRRRLRSFTDAQIQQAVAATQAELQAACAAPRSVDVVWTDAVRASCAALAYVDCSLEHGRNDSLPVIARHRPTADPDDDVFLLPAAGATMDFVDPRATIHIVLRPSSGVDSITLDRRIVTAFVDHLGLALGRMDQ